MGIVPLSVQRQLSWNHDVSSLTEQMYSRLAQLVVLSVFIRFSRPAHHDYDSGELN